MEKDQAAAKGLPEWYGDDMPQKRTYEGFLRELETFVFREDVPSEADVIFLPGNGYPQMAEEAAALYREGYAPWIVPSGRYSITVGTFGGVLASKERYTGAYRSECEFLCDVLIKNGVPEEAILKEDRATYTWENAKNSRLLTDRAGIAVRKAILCCKTHHAGRAYLYYHRAFPEAEILVCPSCVDGIRRDNWRDSEAGVEAMCAETGRILRQFEILMKRHN